MLNMARLLLIAVVVYALANITTTKVILSDVEHGLIFNRYFNLPNGEDGNEQGVMNTKQAIEIKLSDLQEEVMQLIALLNENLKLLETTKKKVGILTDELHQAKKVIFGLEEQVPVLKPEFGSGAWKDVPQDCADMLRLNAIAQSDLHEIAIHGPNGTSHTITVYCDMKTDGGGWMVMQRRTDGNINFDRDHQSYKEGFGNASQEFWLGNEYIHQTSSRWNYELRVDLENFQGERRHAKYGQFLIHPECEDYRLEVDFYSGDAGNALYFNNHMGFSTFDRDRDTNKSVHCSEVHNGPWWHSSCTRTNLNGKYYMVSVRGEKGIFWYDWEGHVSLKSTVMMIRPTPLFCSEKSEKPENPAKPSDCADILRQNPEAPSGGYTIYTTDSIRVTGSMRVFCDMATDGGGWTVFQRRIDGSVDFYLTYQSYIDGFGDVTREFWLGNENLHLLTSGCDQELRFDLMDENNDTRYAQYASFHVGPYDDGYRVNFTTYSGTAGDGFSYHKGMMFTTYDRVQDICPCNCAELRQGAWWYNNCVSSNLNGRHHAQSPPSNNQCILWLMWPGSGSPNHMRFTEMKIRPVTSCLP